ncbi:MAG: hypothetical protein KDC66_03060 [Phaeodactylibacter sp.]|nr:hypothetical protein [Phaeodactylibacter sp.]
MQRKLLQFFFMFSLGLYAFTANALPAGPNPVTQWLTPLPDTSVMSEGFDTDAFAGEVLEEQLLAHKGLGLEFVVSAEILEPFSAAAPGLEHNFEAVLLATANAFESEHILYRSIPLSDCSGMFHRLLRKMKESFPGFEYPEVVEARSSRALAQWYYDHGALHIIDDAANSGQLIRPGAILFFGQYGKKYTRPTIEQLIISGVGIQHIGTAVEVQKDENGQVIGYTMFHARGRGKAASKTQHYLHNPRNSYLPAFGNWKQQLVAIGYIDTAPVEQMAAK